MVLMQTEIEQTIEKKKTKEEKTKRPTYWEQTKVFSWMFVILLCCGAAQTTSYVTQKLTRRKSKNQQQKERSSGILLHVLLMKNQRARALTLVKKKRNLIYPPKERRQSWEERRKKKEAKIVSSNDFFDVYSISRQTVFLHFMFRCRRSMSHGALFCFGRVLSFDEYATARLSAFVRLQSLFLQLFFFYLLFIYLAHHFHKQWISLRSLVRCARNTRSRNKPCRPIHKMPNIYKKKKKTAKRQHIHDTAYVYTLIKVNSQRLESELMLTTTTTMGKETKRNRKRTDWNKSETVTIRNQLRLLRYLRCMFDSHCQFFFFHWLIFFFSFEKVLLTQHTNSVSTNQGTKQKVTHIEFMTPEPDLFHPMPQSQATVKTLS